MNDHPTLFDYSLLDLHATRALRLLSDDSLFLWNVLADQLADRLDDVKRSFANTLEIGSHHGGLKQLLAGKYGIENHLQLSGVAHNQCPPSALARPDCLPIKPYSMDLIISIGQLQWVNDLPGCLTQILHALKPDGLFIALIPGEATLIELRQSMDAAMLECEGGISPRLSPLLTMNDASALMQRAGFALPVIDRGPIDLSYSSPLKLMHDLRLMGQTNALSQRNPAPMTKRLIEKTSDYYTQHFSHPEGGVRATVEIITLTGWAPAKTQAQPLRRGSGAISLKDVL